MSNTNPIWPQPQDGDGDGRRQRSDRSRRRIIIAMFELLREGEMAPSAAMVAARAKVGLRTVFRHFEDKESIFKEMTEELKAIVMPKFMAPLETKDWPGCLYELADRNAGLYEQISPMQVALALRRFESDYLQQQYQSEVDLLRTSLKSVVPKAVSQDRALFAAIQVNLTFATWHRLRADQGLSIAHAKQTLQLILRALVEPPHAD